MSLSTEILKRTALDKQALSIAPFAGMASATSDKVTKAVLVAPILLGLSAGALSSRLTTPAGKIKIFQKELIAEELEALEAEMKRRKMLAQIREQLDAKTTGRRTQRSLHI